MTDIISDTCYTYRMYNHKPADYNCPFCRFSKHEESNYNKLDDIVYEDDKSLAFISPQWWGTTEGNVIVIPKEHYEHIYDLADSLLSHITIVGKQIALGMKATYGCDGTSFRQHNEPGGGQDVWHYHLHVFPRMENDRLYMNTENSKKPTDEEKKAYAQKLRTYFT